MTDPNTETPSTETANKPAARTSDSRIAAVVTAAYLLDLTRR